MIWDALFVWLIADMAAVVNSKLQSGNPNDVVASKHQSPNANGFYKVKRSAGFNCVTVCVRTCIVCTLRMAAKIRHSFDFVGRVRACNLMAFSCPL